MTVAKDLSGQRFGFLTVTVRVPSPKRQARWQVVCDCGSLHEAYGYLLSSGRVRSCGCASGALRWSSRHQTLEERFLAKVQKTTGCWLWTGSKDRQGYGAIHRDNSMERAHRVSHELYKGPIPDGLTIDHLCRNTSCVNPEHLEAVTQQVNILRSDGPCAQNARKTKCNHGHPFDEVNTGYTQKGERYCKACLARARQIWIDRNPHHRRHKNE